MTEKKVLGILAIVFGGVGLVFSWVPFINNLAFVIGLLGFILGIIALILNRKNKKLLAIVGTVISFLSLVLVLVTQNSYSKAFDNATKSVSNSADSSSKKEKSSASSSSEKKTIPKIINTPISVDNGKFEITVTSYKIIPAGQAGNEYGDKTLIAFWYNVKNIKDDKLDPMSAWIVSGDVKAVQDNNSSQVNTLNIGSLPDEKFLDTQTQDIKIGATAENAVSYELSDDTTPVTLSFSKSVVNDDVIAKETFNVK
ncbi:DUF5067 domain-containing protein [Leuconostoc pseudomesenteroides]|uniref:DUF5067 domain-containing protein n=1 Tax=Leuconostoc pseudomesenteroides TaxID=33968 RepID=UPI0039E8F5DE